MTGLTSAVFGMAIAVAVDILVSRVGGSRLAAYGASCIGGFAATLVFLSMRMESRPTWAIGVLAFGAWWFIFLNIVQALESSIRVRVIDEVRRTGGRMRWETLVKRYSDQALLRLRLQRLLDGGAVELRDERLHVVSPGIKLIAGIFGFLKACLLGQSTEFEGLRS